MGAAAKWLRLPERKGEEGGPGVRPQETPTFQRADKRQPKRTEREGSEKWQGSQGRGESWKHREETISRKHLAEPNAKKRSSGVKAGEANGLSNQNSFTGTLKTEGCYFVSMCWQRSECVCSCWGNKPAEKQIKNIGELINEGESDLRRLGAGIKLRGRLTLEREALLRLVLKERKQGGCKRMSVHVWG